MSLAPNRLLPGEGRALLEITALGWLPIGLAVAALLASLAPRSAGRERWLGALGVGYLAALVWILGTSATLLMSGAGPFARAQLGGGAWLAVIGAYLVIFGGIMGQPPGRIRNLTSWAGPAAIAALAVSGVLDSISVARELQIRSDEFAAELHRHVILSAGGVGLAAMLGLPLGIWAAHNPRAAAVILPLVGVIQTVPSLALLGLMIAPLSGLANAFPVLARLGIRGIGAAPALIALMLYGLLPIVRNTYTGLKGVDPATLDAARGMGMTRAQCFWRVEVPVALPAILAGLRTAAVLLIGLTALSSLIGAGGLGKFIFQGLGSAVEDLVLLGALPVLGLAVLTDALLRRLEPALVSKGLR
jgi:osmoprotectant transport system permease protein